MAVVVGKGIDLNVPRHGACMSLVVSELRSADEGAWDVFVRGCPDALPHHLLGWREVITRTYGHRPRYLVAKSAGTVVGVMPLFEVPSRIEGYNFSTLPGGICAATEEAGYALVQRAKELVKSSNARFLAIRDSRRQWDEELISHHSQCAVVVDTSVGLEAVRKRLSRSVRQHLVQGNKSGVELGSVSGQIGPFYDVFSAFLRSRGTPVFSKRYLTSQMEVFPDNLVLVGAIYQAHLIGGSDCFFLGNNVFPMGLFSLDAYHRTRANHLLYWNVIEFACARGFQRADFGRSKIGSGQHRFKMQWGGIEGPIYQQFWLNGTRKIPYLADDADSRNGHLFTRIWQRLPVPVTQTVGPLIRRELPFV
jgi:FemAB-related protein (PEP-CTERM system-associated)